MDERGLTGTIAYCGADYGHKNPHEIRAWLRADTGARPAQAD